MTQLIHSTFTRSRAVDQVLNNQARCLLNRQLGQRHYRSQQLPYVSHRKPRQHIHFKLSQEFRIPVVRFHDLRHTFVSNLIVGEKEDFATVIALSGHKDISMLKRYSHTQEEAKKNAIAKLEKNYLNQPRKGPSFVETKIA